MKKTITIAHWAENFSHKLKSGEDWLKLVEAQAKAAKKKKADILLLPEHVGEHWMHFAPAALKAGDEMRWIAEQAAQIMPLVQKISTKTKLAIVAGSASWLNARSGKCTNRAWMFFPARAPVYHDKLVLTPSEQEPGGWCFEPGREVQVFEWKGLRMAMIICLDVEMPHLGHKLAEADIDLLLVPSMTTKRAGYHRVYNCARTRAVELMTAVAVVGNVGGAKKNGKTRETYQSGAAVYIPAEEVFGHTGVFSDLPLHAKTTGPGKLFLSRNIPVGKIRAVRHGQPEAWPGPWDAKHVKLVKK